jgi:hypothetical protein
MPRISHVTEGVEQFSGERTVGGAELVVVSTPTGLYKVEARGSGGDPAITQEFFTSLPLAHRAIAKYIARNAGTINKKKTLSEGIARRQAAHERALETKNGELINTVNGKKDTDIASGPNE